MELAEAEKPNQAPRVFFKNKTVGGRNDTARDHAETIYQNGVAPPFRLGLTHDSTFHNFDATAHVIGGIKILPHQSTNTRGQRTGVSQGFGNRILAFQRKLFRGARDLKV